ncbi:MAG: hypothetical protein ETSY2_53205 [Candidatus Entotheonella gemina]|uniref:Uncharacterized protein n=1 Tax=Candidatus Entotheonella gemina TaxID=1429439 RepID=W4L5B9_9BACT|nr:MAG: hypothetical protein ETSY2_53205 [Candidatus Entotheonella gemina]
MPGALESVNILDLSNWIAGPFGTMLLGDLGPMSLKSSHRMVMVAAP